MNVLKLIKSIDDVVFISKVKLIEFVVLWLILIELLMRCNVLNWSMFAFDFVIVFELIKNFLNSKKSYRNFVIVLNTYDVSEIDAVISSRLLIWWIKKFSTNCSIMINDSKFLSDSYEMKNWCKLNEFDSIFSNQSKSTLYVSKLIIKLSKKWIVSFSFSFSYSMIHWWIFLLKSNLIRKWDFWFSNFLIELFRFYWVWLIDQ